MLLTNTLSYVVWPTSGSFGGSQIVGRLRSILQSGKTFCRTPVCGNVEGRPCAPLRGLSMVKSQSPHYPSCFREGGSGWSCFVSRRGGSKRRRNMGLSGVEPALCFCIGNLEGTAKGFPGVDESPAKQFSQVQTKGSTPGVCLCFR